MPANCGEEGMLPPRLWSRLGLWDRRGVTASTLLLDRAASSHMEERARRPFGSGGASVRSHLGCSLLDFAAALVGSRDDAFPAAGCHEQIPALDVNPWDDQGAFWNASPLLHHLDKRCDSGHNLLTN